MAFTACGSYITQTSCLDHRQGPAGGRSVGTRADERQLSGMPATLNHFVSVFGYHDARQPLHQITCHITHKQTSQYVQSVMNAAARLIFSSSKFQHITPLLHQLHWLKAPEWIAFKYAVTSVSTGLHMHTLSTSFVRWQMSRLVSE